MQHSALNVEAKSTLPGADELALGGSVKELLQLVRLFRTTSFNRSFPRTTSVL